MRRFNPEKELKKIQHGNRNKVLYGIISLLLIISIGSTYALYQVRYNKRIIYTKVAPFSTHDLDLAVYINDVKSENFPSNMDTYLLDYIDCDKKGITTAKWDYEQDGLSVLTKGPNKCTVYFSSKIEKTFAYNGGVQTFTAPKDGYYKLEVWGAQGKSVDGYSGGAGGYSVGNIKLKEQETLYVVVGGSGTSGGYNGGSENYGGGATHIATTDGILSSLSDNKNSVLIVAGGGGASTCYYSGVTSCGFGGAGGGLEGGTSNQISYKWDTGSGSQYATGGTQTTGGCWVGLGCSSFGAAINSGVGGGGGYYGGGGSGVGIGGGGSGYIGSARLVSGTTQTTNGQNTGDGRAKITYLGNNF